MKKESTDEKDERKREKRRRQTVKSKQKGKWEKKKRSRVGFQSLKMRVFQTKSNFATFSLIWESRFLTQHKMPFGMWES